MIIGIAITFSSLLRDESYTPSIKSIALKQILSCDSGFDKDEKQVWSATKTGYIFDKLK